MGKLTFFHSPHLEHLQRAVFPDSIRDSWSSYRVLLAWLKKEGKIHLKLLSFYSLSEHRSHLKFSVKVQRVLGAAQEDRRILSTLYTFRRKILRIKIVSQLSHSLGLIIYS